MSDRIDCPKAGKEWPDRPDFNLCPTCGADLEEEDQKTLHKERRTLNVLFADISGFTASSEEKDPEEVEEIIDQLFSRLGDVIHQYGGYVDKYMGDAVMTIFRSISGRRQEEISPEGGTEYDDPIVSVHSKILYSMEVK